MPRYKNYVSEVMCANCRKIKRIKIPIGDKIENMFCPHCGMGELHHPTYFFTPDFYYNKLYPNIVRRIAKSNLTPIK